MSKEHHGEKFSTKSKWYILEAPPLGEGLGPASLSKTGLPLIMVSLSKRLLQERMFLL